VHQWHQQRLLQNVGGLDRGLESGHLREGTSDDNVARHRGAAKRTRTRVGIIAVLDGHDRELFRPRAVVNLDVLDTR